MSYTCEKCGEPCEVITLTWYDKDEHFGTPCLRPCHEDVSECCEAELLEVEDEDED